MSEEGRLPPRPRPNNRKRRFIHREAREIIAKVYQYMKKELEYMYLHNHDNSDLSHLHNLQQRTADATGASPRTVGKILKEKRLLPRLDSQKLLLLKNESKCWAKRNRKERVEIIRATVQEFLDEHNKTPTMRKLKEMLQEKVGFTGYMSTLRRLLLDLGYRVHRMRNGVKVLVEVVDERGAGGPKRKEEERGEARGEGDAAPAAEQADRSEEN